MYSIKSISNPFSSFKGESLDSTSIQPILTLLGWQDIQSAVELAEDKDRALAQALQNAYIAYQAAPNTTSKSHLNAVLDSVIKKLDADALQAEKLAQAAALRLKQRETNRESTRNGWMASIRKGLQGLFSPDSIKESLQSLFSSDDTALVERYTALAESYQSKRAALEAYRDALTDPPQTADECPKIEAHQRKLLSETTVPNTIPDQVAYVGEMYDFTIDITEVFGTGMQALAITGNFPDWIQPDYYPLVANCPLPGTENAVTVVGTKAYVASGAAGLYILDIKNPSAPVILGNYDTPGTAYKVAVSNNTAYVADGGTLQILNITNPAKPTYLANYSYLGAVQDVTLHGDFAYVVDGSLLQQLNINNPYNLTVVGGGVLLGVGNQVLMNKDTIYAAATTGVYTYDNNLLSLPIPSLIGQYTTQGYGFQVTVVDVTAYVASDAAGLKIINVMNPYAPTLLGQYTTSGIALGVTIVEMTAYVATWNGLQIINVKNPTVPTLLGQYKTLGRVHDVTVVGATAYVAEWNTWSGLQIINVVNLTAPTLLGQYKTPGQVHDVVVVGTTAYVTEFATWNGLQIINVANPVAPTLLGQYATVGYAFGIVVVGKIAYLTEYNALNSLRIINVTNPTAPILLGQYITLGWATRVTVVGTIAYVAEYNVWNGLQIINVTNPAMPTLLGQYATLDGVFGIAVVGTTAYVSEAYGWNGLQIINVPNYSRNLPLGSYSTLSPVVGMSISNNTATIVLGNEIQQLSLSDPMNPTLLGSSSTLNATKGITQVGVAAYLSEGDNGFQIFNMANTSQPLLMGAYDTPGSVTSITVVNSTAYIADGTAGVQILNLAKIRLRGAPSSSNSGERYNFTVTATDALGNWVTRSFQVIVRSAIPIVTHNQLSLQNGEKIVLTPNNLEAVDATRYAAPDLIFVISSPLNGHFASIQTPNQNITAFSQKYVRDGVIQFVHVGNQQVPSYAVVVTDGLRNSLSSIPTIYFADAPILKTAGFIIKQNQTIVLNQSNFNAIIPLSPSFDNASQILYEISNVENGYFAVNDTPTSNFTQQQVNQKQVSVSQDGSPNAPSCTVTVTNTDSGISTAPQPVQAKLQDNAGNSAPIVLVNQLSIKQGETSILTLDHLKATIDGKQNVDSEIVWFPSKVQNGDFYLTRDPRMRPPSFTQADVVEGKIQFVQDGSRKTPDYRLKARSANNGLSSSVSEPLITFQTINFPPVLFQSIPDQLISLGTAFDFGIPETTFKDPDGDPIILSAQGFNQSALPDWLTFDFKLARFTGVSYQPGLILIQIIGSDPEMAFATTQFAIVTSGKTPDNNLRNTIYNAAIAAVVSGVVGFGFFGARYCLSKRLEKQLNTVLEKMYSTKVEKETEEWKQNTLLPLAHELFARFKTTGLCGQRGEKETGNYLKAITKLLSALEEQGVETDFSELKKVDRLHFMNIAMAEIHRVMIENKKCCSRAGFFSSCRPTFTAEQLSAKAGLIAQAIGSELNKGKSDEPDPIELKGEKKWPKNKKGSESFSEPSLHKALLA